MSIDPAQATPSTLWQKLAAAGHLRCPACGGPLTAHQGFTCSSCAAVYPVESGVPLLMRPEEVVSIPDRVMETFRIGEPHRRQVEAALSSLVKYRTPSHPEFANFFARFEAQSGTRQLVALSAAQIEDALQHVVCVTTRQPATLRSDEAEFRSIRLRNGSPLPLFTSETTGLFLSYRLFTPQGEPVAFEASRSPLPVPLHPGAELTIPALVRLPPDARGDYLVRFHFLLATQVAPVEPPAPVGWRLPWKARPAPLPVSVEEVRWFDAAPVLEMLVIAVPEKPGFPALRRGRMDEFEVHADVELGDDFLRQIVAGLREQGVDRPRILEVGAGVYSMAMRIADSNTEVVVSDISLVMQALALVMHSGFPAVLEGRAAFGAFDMMYPPFANGTFDIICISAALHHIPLPGEFLRRLAPLLSPNGRFVAVREPCLVNPAEPAYISELSNGFNEQMFELPEWLQFVSSGGLAIDHAAIDFECSLKFSARSGSDAAALS
nr:methyltransferase domain-containing protein [uncultured Lichenicoccus sp.]